MDCVTNRAILPQDVIFHGRASRGEYWWVHLFTILLTAAVGIISVGIGSLMGYSFGNGSDIIDSPLSNLMDNAAIVVELVLWIPNLSLSVRRLHDENRRGWGCGLSGRGSAASARLVDYWWHCVGNGVFGSRLRVYQTRRGRCTTGLFRTGCSRIRDAAISIGGWQHYSGCD
jgi:uncharacterized membrane protein YhaH (DUF805 family)